MGCTLLNCCRRLYRAGCCHCQPDGASGSGESGNALAGSATIPSYHLTLQYSSLTQPGYYPNSPDRQNQDTFCVKTQLLANPNLHFFGVFDGHGPFGTECANFTRDRLLDILSADTHLPDDPIRTFNSAFVATNNQLHDSQVDDTKSGTTAITVLVSGDTLYVANVGDSRAVAGVRNGDRIAVQELSLDQTPFRRDEYERVRLCGARVLSIDQLKGIKDPDDQSWGDKENDEGDPPRLWVKDELYPGTAFTRSVGDATAESIGVIAVPEVMTVKITPNHLFFVVASDGVFKFLSSQDVIDMVARFADPQDACKAVFAESRRLWLKHGNKIDDITIIIVQIKDSSNFGSGGTNQTDPTNKKASIVVSHKGRAKHHILPWLKADKERKKSGLTKAASCNMSV